MQTLDVRRFLNSLQCEDDLVRFLTALRSGLTDLFDDVDRVSVNANRWLTSGSVPERLISAMHLHLNDSQEPRLITDSLGGPATQRIVRALQRVGYSSDQYHEPIGFDYFTERHSYVGSVLLWRDRAATRISQETIEFVESIGPFISFLLISAVSRFQKRHRLFAQLGVNTRRSLELSQLTARELEVVLNCLNGHSTVATAKVLGVSEATVRTHIKSIRRKLNIPHGEPLSTTLVVQSPAAISGR